LKARTADVHKGLGTAGDFLVPAAIYRWISPIPSLCFWLSISLLDFRPILFT
jgi:hypothetical protein